MGFTDEYLALREKRKKKKVEEETKKVATSNSFSKEYAKLRAERIAEEEDIAPVRSSASNVGYSTSAPISIGTSRRDEDEEEDDGKLDFFKKSKGNIAQAILGTVGDAALNVTQGVFSLGEGIVDLAAYGVAGVADLVGADEFSDDLKRVASKNQTDYMFGGAQDWVDDYSVLGRTSDAILQGVGQVGGIIATGGLGAAAGLGTAGATALTTGVIGLSGVGSGMGEAYESGATDGEAFTYGLIQGSVEAGTELLFGGLGKTVKALGISRGLSSLDDVFAAKLSSRISNNVAKTLVQAGVKASGEGFEEVLSGIGSAVGKKLTYMSDEELSKLVEDENLLEQFVVGTVTSGIAQGGDVKTSIKTGQDFISGLTENEQKVVDKVYQDTIAEAEKDGKKLTNKEKSKIYDEVMEDFESGAITIDKIESALGGDTYNSYKEILDSEESMHKEWTDLKAERDTLAKEYGEQTDRKAELKQQMEDLKQQMIAVKQSYSDSIHSEDRAQLKQRLSDEVFAVAKDSRLMESYNEDVRSRQKLQVDLNEYKGEARNLMQALVEKGQINNSNSTKKFWGWAVNTAAERGMKITSTTTEEILEMETKKHGEEYVKEAFAGKIPDAYVLDDGTLAINVKSKQARRFLFGHEITHTMEKSKYYKELQDMLFSYAETKMGKEAFDGRKKDVERRYKGIKDANATNELTSDLVGEYIYFCDEEFVKNLSMDSPGSFKAIWNDVKLMFKAATAGTQEARDLAKIERLFAKMYRETSNATNKATDSGNAKHSLSDAKIPNYEELAKKKPIKIVDISTPATNGTFSQRRSQIMANIDQTIAKPYLNKDTGALIFLTKESYKHAFNNIGDTQLNASEHLPELIENAVLTHGEAITHGNKFANGVYTFFAAAYTGKVQPVKLKVKEYEYRGQELPQNIKAYFDNSPQGYAASYDTVVLEVVEIEESPPGSAKEQNQNDSFLSPSGLSEISIAELLNLVNGDAKKFIPQPEANFSLSEADNAYLDAVNRGDTDAVQNMVDEAAKEAGYTIRAYHGTKTKTEFTVFEKNKIGSGAMLFASQGKGFYFTASDSVANKYAGDDGKVVKTMLKMEHPFEFTSKNNSEANKLLNEFAVQHGRDFNISDYSGYVNFEKRTGSVLSRVVKGDGESFTKFLQEKGYDGIIYTSFNYDTNESDNAYVVFEPEQVKSADPVTYDDAGNVIPLSERFNAGNNDIRYHLSEYTPEEKRAHNDAVRDYFGKTYMWAETGYLLLDGTKLDMSGKHEGAPGGYRTVDHRDIVDALGDDYGDGSYSGSLVQFMSEGNIRIIPEMGGINLSVQPTEAQEKALAQYVQMHRGEVVLDIDDANGYTVASVEYPIGTRASKVLGDIRGWFENGTKPEPVYSVSWEDEAPVGYGRKDRPMSDTAYVTDEVAPVQDVAPVAEEAPVVAKTVKQEADELIRAITDEEFRLQGYAPDAEQYAPATEEEANKEAQRTLRSMTDKDAPPVAEDTSPEQKLTAEDPFRRRDWDDRKTKAFITDNPDAKPFFQEAAEKLAEDYAYTQPAEKGFNDELYYESGGEKGFWGHKRYAADDINTLLDVYGLSYAQIDEGLDAIIHDTPKVNNKPAKTIELILNDRLLKGSKMWYSGEEIPPNQAYITWLNEQQHNQIASEDFASITDADAPMEDIAPVMGSGTSASSLMDIANQGRRDNLKGAYTQDGKQYISDGSFIAELNTVDDSLAQAENFPAKKVLAELNEAEARQAQGDYSIDAEEIAALNNGDRNFIKVGDSLFDAKYVDALFDAIENPVFTMSHVHGGDNALFVTGSNGRAVLMPVRAGGNVNIAYEAQPVVDAPVADVAPTRAYEAIRPPKMTAPVADDGDNGGRMMRADNPNTRPGEKQRKWVGTSTESEAVNREVLPDDLDQDAIHYQPIPNKVTLGKANARLDGMGFDASVTYFNSQFANKKVSLEDIALGERLIQEAIKKGDTKTAGELIQNVAILGTELGQKVQALSIIKRLTPEGQLKMLQKVVERGKTKGDKAYDGVELTQDMIDKILSAYANDGSFDQTKLNEAVEDAKQKLADQMKVGKMDKANAWRYLSMLGNPKTHIRNLVSNVAMRGTVAVKNVIARTVEDIAPISNRTKTWKHATDYVKAYAQKTAAEMQDILQDGGKYSEDASIKAKRKIFKNNLLNWLSDTNSELLSKEDWWFSKPAFVNALSECLTANGIRTEQDLLLNPDIVEKARAYATEQSQIATFRQYSWLANKINEIESKNTATQMAVGAILPFKKTPINIAKAGLSYSPLGFAKTLTYDISQVKKGNMESSELVDHLAQNITGTALTLAGYLLASAGLLSGAGDDDKEGEYDYQLGEQSYAVNIGGKSYSLSWLSPVAMPLFVGANAYEQLVEGKEWNGDVVVQTLAQTLDPLSEMSFISGLDSVLSSYDSGIEKFAGIGEAMVQNYATQFVPTISSQLATATDDTKRSTKVSGDSGFKAFDETINKIKLKIPGLRQTLEPSTDIWGNDVKLTENVVARAVESFIAPYAVRENTATEIDAEIQGLYSETGDNGIIPSIPANYINYKNEKYKMSAEDFTAYKKTYGQTAYDLLGELFDTSTYRNSGADEQADLVNRVYDYARDVAKKELLAKQGVSYTNATEDGVEVYKEDAIKGAIYYDVTPDEYTFMKEYPEKYAFFKDNNISYEAYKAADEDEKRAYTWAYENPEKMSLAKAVAGGVVKYRQYASDLYDIKADKDSDGKSISGSRKAKVAEYINNLDAEYGEKIILFKSEYNADDTYNLEIVEYLNSRDDISYEEMETILKELGFTVHADGRVTW